MEGFCPQLRPSPGTNPTKEPRRRNESPLRRPPASSTPLWDGEGALIHSPQPCPSPAPFRKGGFSKTRPRPSPAPAGTAERPFSKTQPRPPPASLAKGRGTAVRRWRDSSPVFTRSPGMNPPSAVLVELAYSSNPARSIQTRGCKLAPSRVIELSLFVATIPLATALRAAVWAQPGRSEIQL